MPLRDLLLSPDHAVLADGHLIPVRYLCNGATVARQEVAEISYYHVELPRHAALLAEGMPAESYLDTGNRHGFADPDGRGRRGAALQHPDHVARALATWAAQACAPLATGGEVVAAVRARLEARALALGWCWDDDPGLRLEIDGVDTALRRAGDRWSARLPAGARAAVLRSRHFVPAELGPAHGDGRRLGVAVTGLWLDGAPVALDAAAFTAHWHAPEPGLRWSDGQGHLDPAGASRLELRLALLPVYRRPPPALPQAA